MKMMEMKYIYITVDTQFYFFKKSNTNTHDGCMY